jgi:hypothetical protein
MSTGIDRLPFAVHALVAGLFGLGDYLRLARCSRYWRRVCRDSSARPAFMAVRGLAIPAQVVDLMPRHIRFTASVHRNDSRHQSDEVYCRGAYDREQEHDKALHTAPPVLQVVLATLAALASFARTRCDAGVLEVLARVSRLRRLELNYAEEHWEGGAPDLSPLTRLTTLTHLSYTNPTDTPTALSIRHRTYAAGLDQVLATNRESLAHLELKHGDNNGCAAAMFDRCGTLPSLQTLSLSYFTLAASTSPTTRTPATPSNWDTFAECVAPKLVSLSLDTCIAPSLMPSRFVHLRHLRLVDYTAWSPICERLGFLESLTLESRSRECSVFTPEVDSWPALRVLVVNNVRVTDSLLCAAPRLERLECGGVQTEITLDVVLKLALTWSSPALNCVRIALGCHVTNDGRWRTATFKTPNGKSHKISMGDTGQHIVAFLVAVGKHPNVSCSEDTRIRSV